MAAALIEVPVDNVFSRLFRCFDTHRFRLLGLAIFSAVYVFGCACLFTCDYVTNDSALLLEYGKQGLPIAYMGMLFTGFLHLAYTAVPDMPWYGLSLYAMHVLSVFLWLWLLSRVFQPRWLAMVFSAAFLAYYLTFLIHLDYTSTAIMLCDVSLAWVFLDAMEQKTGYLRFLGAGGVFTLGWLVRPEVPLGALAYALPLALMAAFWRLREQPLAGEVRRLALISLVFFAPVVVNIAGDTVYRHYTLTPQQAQFDAFNAARGKLMNGLTVAEKGVVIRDNRLLATSHLTRHDVRDLFGWNFLDERVDNATSLQALLDGVPPTRISRREFVKEMIFTFPRQTAFLLFLCCMLLSIPVLLRRVWLGGLGLLAPVYWAALTTYMSLAFLFLHRVELPFSMGFGFLCLLICGTAADRAYVSRDRVFLSIVLLGALLCCRGAGANLGHEVHLQGQSAGQAEATRGKLEILNRDYAGRVILLKPDSALALETLAPLDSYQLLFRPIDLGWNTFSPLFYQQIGALGIQHGYQLVDALIANPDAYLLGQEYWCNALLQYASDSDKRHIAVVEVRRFPDGTGLYRLEEMKK